MLCSPCTPSAAFAYRRLSMHSNVLPYSWPSAPHRSTPYPRFCFCFERLSPTANCQEAGVNSPWTRYLLARSRVSTGRLNLPSRNTHTALQAFASDAMLPNRALAESHLRRPEDASQPLDRPVMCAARLSWSRAGQRFSLPCRWTAVHLRLPGTAPNTSLSLDTPSISICRPSSYPQDFSNIPTHLASDPRLGQGASHTETLS